MLFSGNFPLNKVVRNVTLITAAFAVIFSFFFVFVEPSFVEAATPEEIAAARDNVTGNNEDEGFNFSCDGIGTCVTRAFIEVGIITIQFSFFILSIVGVLLDVSLLLSFNMGALISPSTTLGKVVAESWTVFRDLTNLLFIAGLIWASIGMILQISVPGGNVGRFVAKILVAAALVNFSFFFTGAIIDASNTVSRLIYQQGVLNGESITVGNATNQTITDMVSYVTGNEDFSFEGVENVYLNFIGAQFMHQTKLVSILDPESLRIVANENANASLILLVFMGAILIGATIELFVSMFFTIIARFIILMVLLITSPLIVFKFMGIPMFDAWGDQWWKSLMSQVIFLPIFVFLIAISFRVINGLAETVNASEISLVELLGSPTGGEFETALGLILLFVVAWGLLKYSKTISQNIAQGKQVALPSVEGVQKFASGIGDRSGSWVRNLAGFPRAAIFGAAGSTLNAIGNRYGIQEGAERAAESVGAARTRLPGFLGGTSRFEYDRQQRLKDAGGNRVKDATEKIEKWEALHDQAVANGDVQGIAAADAELRKQKERKESGYKDMYESMGAQKFAREIAGYKEKDRNNAIDALDSEKAEEVIAQLEKIGVKTKINKDEEEKTHEEILSELKAGRREDRRATYQKHATELRDMAAEQSTARELIAAIREAGGNAGDELSADMIVGNEAVIRELSDDDMVLIKGREDISDEAYADIQRKRGIAEDRGFTPSDAARDS